MSSCVARLLKRGSCDQIPIWCSCGTANTRVGNSVGLWLPIQIFKLCLSIDTIGYVSIVTHSNKFTCLVCYAQDIDGNVTRPSPVFLCVCLAHRLTKCSKKCGISLLQYQFLVVCDYQSFLCSVHARTCASTTHALCSQMLIPRISYFPLVYDRLEKLYGRAVKQEPSDEIWLSSEAVALKW